MTRLFRAALLLTLAGLVACQHAPVRERDFGWDPQPLQTWHGRLALRIESSPPQSLQAHFELSTAQNSGQLRLSSPLGTTLADIAWEPGRARLLENGRTHLAETPEQLLETVTGQAWPIAAWQAWLRGEAQPVPGWDVDLSEHAQGKLSAHRTTPLPTLGLRLVFEHTTASPASNRPSGSAP